MEASYCEDSPLPTLFSPAQEFATAAFSQQASWNSNSRFKCDQEEWRLDREKSKDQIARIKKLIADQGEKAGPGELPSPQKFAEDMRAILGETSVQTWTISMMNQIKKFHSIYDAKTVERLQAEKVKFNVDRQWLFTDQTVYKYFGEQNALYVEALDPFTQGYPFRLDVFNFAMGLTGDEAGFLKGVQMEPKSNGVFIAKFGAEGEFQLSIRAADGRFQVQELKFHSKDGKQSLERYFLNQSSIGQGLDVPLSVVQIQISGDAAEVQLFTLSDVEFGKVTPQDIALKIPSSAAISDEQVPNPIKPQ